MIGNSGRVRSDAIVDGNPVSDEEISIEEVEEAETTTNHDLSVHLQHQSSTAPFSTRRVSEALDAWAEMSELMWSVGTFVLEQRIAKAKQEAKKGRQESRTMTDDEQQTQQEQGRGPTTLDSCPAKRHNQASARPARSHDREEVSSSGGNSKRRKFCRDASSVVSGEGTVTADCESLDGKAKGVDLEDEYRQIRDLAMTLSRTRRLMTLFRKDIEDLASM